MAQDCPTEVRSADGGRQAAESQFGCKTTGAEKSGLKCKFMDTIIMNIQQLVDRGESETLEFKEKFDERAIESAVAFANTNGGIVLIGVSDNGRINGMGNNSSYR